MNLNADFSLIYRRFLLWVFSSLSIISSVQSVAYTQVDSLNIEKINEDYKFEEDPFVEAIMGEVKIAEANSRIDLVASLYSKLADKAYASKQFVKAQEWYATSADYYLRCEDEFGFGSEKLKVALALSSQSKVDSALLTFFEILEIADKSDNLKFKMLVNLRFTQWLHQQSDYKEAVQYSKKTVTLIENLENDSLMAEVSYLHGFALMRNRDLKEAIVYFNRSEALFKRLGDYDGQARVLNAMADLMAQENKWLLAFEAYQKSIELLTISQNYASMYRSYINFAGLLIKLKRTPEILKFFEQGEFEEEYSLLKTYLEVGIFWARQQQDLEFQVLGYKYLTQIYFSKGDYKTGLHYNVSYDSLQELAYKEQRIRIEEVKRRYDNRRKDLLINNLEKDNTLAALEAERNRLISYLLASFVLVLLIIGISAYYRNKDRKLINRQLLRKNIEIEKQRRILQEQNEELVQKNKMIEQQKDALQRAMVDLKNTQSKLVQSERLASVYQLTSGLIHEINNPVNAISGGVQSLTLLIKELNQIINLVLSLESGNLSSDIILKIIDRKEELFLQDLVDDINALINSISNGTERTHAIINSLKVFNRLDDEKFMKADINDIVRAIVERLPEHSNKEFSYSIMTADLPQVQCYPELVELALKSIVKNALWAIPEVDGVVKLSTSVCGSSVCVTVADNGFGMSEDILNRIFEPFFSTKAIGRGAGLGLAIAHGIIQKHRGKITVNSTPGKGAEFKIQIPISAL